MSDSETDATTPPSASNKPKSDSIGEAIRKGVHKGQASSLEMASRAAIEGMKSGKVGV
jgi:hypothetical protein